MTDKAYWEERKLYVKLSNAVFTLVINSEITEPHLIDILTERYGKQKIVELENEELENFRQWLIECQKQDSIIFSSSKNAQQK